jgi:sulfate adenylyltransferase subunit 2
MLEAVPVVPLYYSAERPVVERGGNLIVVDDERFRFAPGERVSLRPVRFRTLGCYPLSGAIPSSARSVPEILEEMLRSKHSERQGRLIDHDEEGSMETKKREGYF